MAKIQSPPGTRDMYPADLLKRRYIEKLWRDTSIRHGFEEIDGPTFEHADLYAVKSGQGILSEVFQVFSGKDEAEVSRIRGGSNAPYALRPEFTPTLARMYAAKAGSLPKPTKWFWQQNCFRAEKQQRGRLREFGQWNCDTLGAEEPDGELFAVQCIIDLLSSSGLTPSHAKIHLSHKTALQGLFPEYTIAADKYDEAYSLLDAVSKMEDGQLRKEFMAIGVPAHRIDAWISICKDKGGPADPSELGPEDARPRNASGWGMKQLDMLSDHLAASNDLRWCHYRPSLARGLAYYTGTVFEVLANGERAIAGGGRYDNLIELFGGPATPAVGFGMGDVVLSLVLQDRGLLPEGDALMEALSRPSASYRPDAFVISAGQSPEEQEAAAKQVRPLVAKLRRGVESKAYTDNAARKPWDANRYDLASGGAPPFHARSSSKSTKNIGKLLQDAVAQKAKLAVILENAGEATIKDLRTNQQDTARTKIADLGRVIAERLEM